VHELQLHVAVAARDKTAVEQIAAAIREERDRLLSQQDRWEEMHRAAEQIQLLTSQVNEADNEELRQLRDYHDRTRPLEGEYSNLQRRFKDQETKLASLDRTIVTVRQTLAQAHQRSVEWEKRAKETDTEISGIRSQLEETSDAKALLDSEVSLLKTQLQEKEADERLTQVS
jgi:chromosome segregation ATPase